MTEPLQLDMQAILERLPHRYPFLLVDRVLECRPGESIRALKNVTYNEPYFPGHFPGRPVMPGVIIIEALALAAGHLEILDRGFGGRAGGRARGNDGGAGDHEVIDARAVVSGDAQLAADVSVGPFSIIGAGVTIGAR